MEAVIQPNAIAAEAELALPTFSQALEIHKAMVYSILWHFLHDRALADELAQDIFLELHRSWNSLKSPAHLASWLRRVTTHRAIDQVRKRKSRPETSLEETAEPTVFERVHDGFLSYYLERMVASLPPQQRMLLILRYQEDMEWQEIADVLDMKVSTAKTQAARALELLRAKTSHRLRPGDA
ncbi:MAG: sigma-70 family RNA polymerase sigma factor [Acidobacteriaceae bacterium]|nr:sigma-70 family RNA polymerase sigma factor [Acidobacteriaceae bacterium]